MQELTRPVEPEPRRKPSWWIAAAAFAAVIVIVGAVVLLTRPTSDVAPATETPTTEAQSLPTTTVAAASESEDPEEEDAAPPVLDEAATSVARSIVDAINQGDAQAVAAIIMSAGSVESTDTPGEDARARESGRLASWALLESRAELAGCTTNTSGVTRCEILRSSALDYTSTDPQLSIIEVRMGDDVVEWMRFDGTLGAWFAIEQRFFDWIVENHPADRVPIFVDFSDPEETASLIRDRYAEWLESAE